MYLKLYILIHCNYILGCLKKLPYYYFGKEYIFLLEYQGHYYHLYKHVEQGQYYIDELEADFGKPTFGQVAFNRGVGTFINNGRNYCLFCT